MAVYYSTLGEAATRTFVTWWVHVQQIKMTWMPPYTIQYSITKRPIDYLGLSNPDASQSFLTGGGTGVDTVAIDTSPIIRRASLHAWYIRSISSRFRASSGLSSIICAYFKQNKFWQLHDYKVTLMNQKFIASKIIIPFDILTFFMSLILGKILISGSCI